MADIQVFQRDGQPKTTSLNVAAVFGKKHKNVLQAAERLGCSERFTRLNFQPSSYTDPTGRTVPMVEMTRDGFTILAMGFTGPKAMAFKEAYISQFNAMEAALRSDKPSGVISAAEEGNRIATLMGLSGDRLTVAVAAVVMDRTGENLLRFVPDLKPVTAPRAAAPETQRGLSRGDQLEILVASVATATEPFTLHSKKTGLYARRARLLEPLNGFGRNKLASLAEELLKKGRLKRSPSKRLIAA